MVFDFPPWADSSEFLAWPLSYHTRVRKPTPGVDL